MTTDHEGGTNPVEESASLPGPFVPGAGVGSDQPAGARVPVAEPDGSESGYAASGTAGSAGDGDGIALEEERAGLAAEVGETIQDFPDFPKAGILFRDIMPLFQRPRLLRRVVEALAREADSMGAEKIVGIESRGFLLGPSIALELGLPFVTVRKAGKLPGQTVGFEYELEYGTAEVQVQRDRIRLGERIVLVDDLLATGGTASASARVIEQIGGIVAGITFLIELEALQGRDRLGRYNLFSLLML